MRWAPSGALTRNESTEEGALPQGSNALTDAGTRSGRWRPSGHRWLGGREARRVERWVGLVFALAIFVPIYRYNDSTPLMAVAHEMTKPIVEMMNRYIEGISQK